ncbi:FAD/NAD(P)-binding protein [Corynebacterium halotolerans]|uniref:FAD-dependent urate hydroxylase HpyO/Asp monooxygenase CreE-like FAD/NAD(P)-binding domain-containing protein n=1 Tax=Corynebacterium halotolerans YIM 70093 = DSM 44683 TaxID=1121362 RepID=M1MZV5_9CORY|nr:hypothetical protein A605_11270 [Corynebacterium halotolerans YIM 70093 = DSM 44683]
MSTLSPAIAIVGMGPRGTSVVERLGTALRELPADERPGLTLHLIDDAQHGAGRIWDTGQTRTLCMNTLSGAVTLFTEPRSTVAAPVFEGPILHEWIRLLRGDPAGIDPGKVAVFDEFPPGAGVAESFAAEIAVTVPESHPSRALYGAYLRWVLDVALHRLPDNVTVVDHHARATAVAADDDRDRDLITLSDGAVVPADATVLAHGWQVPGPTHAEAGFAHAEAQHAGLRWIRPGNPVDQPVEQVPESGTVLVRGLGMGFFDAMALLTVDRGGRFHEDPATRSGLRYELSGREPHLVVTSHRGYPYLPKSDFGGLPPKAELRRLRAVITELSGTTEPASIDFDSQVWPAIVRDAYEAYYRVLNRVRPESVTTSFDEIVAVIDAAEIHTTQVNAGVGTLDAALAPHSAEPFTLTRWLDPLGGVGGTRHEVTAAIATALVEDIRQATLGPDSPLKAALWSISASRKPSAVLGAEGRYTFESRRNLFATMMSLGQMAGSGPPLFRTRQLLALVDAGLVTFLGADPKLRVDLASGEWVAHSHTTGDAEVRSMTLVDAWMHKPDVRRPADPLAVSLDDAGRLRPFRDTTTDGTGIATGSPEVDPATRLLVRADGRVDPRVHLIGIPTHAQLPDTTISMPGTDPLMLQETDTAALHALQVALGT